MGQAGPEVVSLVRQENLSLIFHAAKRGRVNDPIAVTLKRCPIWVLLFREAPPPRLRRFRSIWRKLGKLEQFDILPFT
jgi:hypothetical protein